ncbi:hypothetical protein HY643_04235, partial [Candidatus Woesearchaeota archaeon]|nr:hypothetical protein [Candidatus Woesearchaeota archaeon]
IIGYVVLIQYNKFRKTATNLIEEDFGCWPPSCSLIKDPYGKRICEDWKAGREVTWPPDCLDAQTPECRRLCEYEKNRTKKTDSYIPINISPSIASFPKSPADFLFHTRAPACVDPNNEYSTRLVYARPFDRKDRYQEISQTLRGWMANANGIVNNEAEKFGMTTDIKIACTDGEIIVLNVLLQKSEAAYNTHDGKTTVAIVTSMKALGYDDKKTKYIIYYDGDSDGCEGGKAKCSGQFVNRGVDDRLSEDNLYNSGPDYSIIYGGGVADTAQRYNTQIDFLAPIILLHEYSHTLGAVQLSAPHSNKDEIGEAGHCNDEPPAQEGGNDVMCKSDKLGAVFGDACKESNFVFHYDCNNDDYFNPKPESGAYLATHWNLGSPLNRYFKIVSQKSPPF